MTYDSEDVDLTLAAMAYVDAVHRALTAENTAPPPGVEGRVVAAILADAALVARVREWAATRPVLEAQPEDPPPIDHAYRRVRDLLLAAAGAGG